MNLLTFSRFWNIMPAVSGIACAGNWIVDHIKIIDCWPEEGALTTIRSSDIGIGGSSANVLTDLRTLGFPAPMIALGCIGDDEYGRFILDHCKNHQIDTSLIHTIRNTSTSYTDVMTIAATGDRTFFHHRGANGVFGSEHVDPDLLTSLSPRIFHLGYLLLLDAMDETDDEFGTVAARVLAAVQATGIQTSVDVVSEASDRFARIVRPALRYTDHCIINDYEAERITGIRVRPGGGRETRDGLAGAARALMDMGVSRTAVVHCPDGGVWVDSDGAEVWLPSLTVPPEMIVSAVGAGDAFCAGVLYGIHEGWPPEECLRIANATAATCLCAKNTTDGVRSLSEVREFAAELGTSG